MTHNFITCLGIWPCTVCLWHLRLTYFYNALPCLCAPSVNTDCHNVFAQDICQGTKWEHRMNTKQTCSLAFIVSGYQDQTDTFVCLSVWLYQSIMCWKFTGFRQCTTVCICLGELFWKFRSFFFFFFLLLFFPNGFETICALIDFASRVCVTIFRGKTNRNKISPFLMEDHLVSWCHSQLVSTVGSCGSGVEPAYCYWTITGSIPLVCMSKCLWARFWTPNYSWCAGWHLAW